MNFKHILFGLLVSSFLYSCEKTEDTEIQILDHTRSEVTNRLTGNSSLVHRVYTDTTIILHAGVESTDIHFMDSKGHSIRAFILKADMNKADLKLQPLTPFGSEAFAMQTIPDMLKYVSKDLKVLFGVNSDFFNTSTGEPRSILYLQGKPIRTIIPAERSYFGVNKNGQLIIGDGLSYEANKSEIYNAVGGHHTLVRDGVRVGQTDVSVEPRTAVGFTSDNIVYFVVVDGRRYDYSYGINLTDLSEIMLALGSWQSINLDGGGSSTYVINNPLGQVLQVRNWSSDRSPRAVANGWALVSKTP